VRALFIILFCLLSAGIYAQGDSVVLKPDTLQGGVFIIRETNRGGVVLPEVEIKEVTIVGRVSKGRQYPYARYERLVYNLKKVYPYSLIVRGKLTEVNYELERIPGDMDKKKYLRDIEKDVFREYEDDVRRLTITQGRLLLKLIDRETRNTSFVLIQQYRGSLSASFWQAIARVFGTNLKEEYDPAGEDALIERIVLDIEAGLL
jgi:hypothetical protein